MSLLKSRDFIWFYFDLTDASKLQLMAAINEWMIICRCYSFWEFFEFWGAQKCISYEQNIYSIAKKYIVLSIAILYCRHIRIETRRKLCYGYPTEENDARVRATSTHAAVMLAQCYATHGQQWDVASQMFILHLSLSTSLVGEIWHRESPLTLSSFWTRINEWNDRQVY